MSEIKQIPLDLIDPSPFQMRSIMDEELLEQLAESLKRDGQQRPVKVRSKGDRYELVFGHRTFSAAPKAGLTGLQAIVEDLTDEQVMWAQYAENEFREDISDYDRAKWLRTMIDKFSYTQEQLGEKIGKERSRIAQFLRMLQLEPFVTMVTISNMTERQARAILEAPEDIILEVITEIEERFKQDGFILTPKGIEERIEYFKAMKEYRELPSEAKLESLKEEEGIVSEETLKPLGVEASEMSTPISEESKGEEVSPPNLEQRPKEASAEMREFLEDRFKRYSFLMSKHEPWFADSFSRNFDVTEEEANKIINNYRDQRRKAQSSGMPKEQEEKPKIEVQIKKPELDTWATRKARMSPPISEMEQTVQNMLQSKGYFFEAQKEVPIRTVIPDLWFEGNPPLSVFLDGPVHEGREDRDEELRDLLRKRGVKVLSIRYERPTKEAVEEAVKQILEILEGENL